MSERTLRRHVKPSEKEKQKRGRKSKIVSDNLSFLLSLATYDSKDKNLTQKEMANKLKERGISVSRQTISRFLRRNKKVKKNIIHQPFVRENEIRLNNLEMKTEILP